MPQIGAKLADVVGFLLGAARDSRGCARQWLRYLRKVVGGSYRQPTEAELERVLGSGELSMYQQVSLVRALTPGTPTNACVADLDRLAKTRMLDELRRRRAGD